jgi:hypothetical protein
MQLSVTKKILAGYSQSRTKASRESRCGLVRVAVRIEGNRVERWDEGGGEGQDMRAVAHEDQKGEVVAENEFEQTCDEEQETAEPDTAGIRCRGEPSSAAPSHCLFKSANLEHVVRAGIHVLSSMDKGNTATEKPMMARGVGLANLLRRSPGTSRFGLRYSFSKSSGVIVMVLERW